ncbi:MULTISPECIES: GntR family transcriptional regulator [Mammaliicoccus]|uniref:GntR family transcriptional regulator n=1 Tax=Mammaliicoccus lentus TaxID=42858 RepID=A0ABS6GXX1_MAMLE|nr:MULTISPECIES: GntR family transcriptional regulator [Mammaliicoccus]MBF0750028.1 GntR family transcriptional regulator [Mammaliicoccus lentus]MBF0840484.1 GntR family transcriptional regulator [Mammaliicoccus lentus]MBU6114284.1 GntR family transcriptional regulator [Mammaliicoccus lentus]QMU10950.1 GntR family transcriptional regulator [Mammaliicoccus lentus]TFU56945.1 GntR family transcriptional regulator [Mammaliicoccus lentus]
MSNDELIEYQKLKVTLNQIAEQIDEQRLPIRAYHIIRIAIKQLKLKPGQTLLEREIAEVLEMSRTPVREALVRLQTEGLLTLVPRKGFIINPIKKQDLKEIYEITESLDGLAVELATSKITQENINHLKHLVSLQQESLDRNDLYNWSILDDQFHADLISFAQNTRLSSVINIHSDQLYRARLYTINNRPIPYQSIVEHRAIIACMEAKDKNAARFAMQSHRNRAWEEIAETLEE